MCALVTGFQTCALPIYGLSRDLEFCAHHPRLVIINQLRKGTKGRVGPADELFIAIIIIECGATELHPTIKQRRPETRFIRKQAFLRHWSNLRCEDGGHDAVAPRFITLGYGNIKQAVGSDLVIDTSTPGDIIFITVASYNCWTEGRIVQGESAARWNRGTIGQNRPRVAKNGRA